MVIVHQMPRLSSYVCKRPNPDTADDESVNNWSHIDLKYFDSELASTSVVASTTTWAGGEYPPATIGTLFLPVRGSGITNRIGRSVRLRWLLISGTVQVPVQLDATALPDASSRVRLYLVQNKQANGTQTQAEDVIQSGTNIVPLDMFRSLSTIGTYNILDDADIVMDNQNFNVAGGVGFYQSGFIRKFKFSYRFSPFTSEGIVNFKSDLGDYRDILDNSFTIIGITNVSTNQCSISYKARFAFHDN